MSRIRVGETKWFICRACNERREVFCKVEGELPEVSCKRCAEPCEALEKASKAYWRPFTPYYHHQLGEHFATRSDEKAWAKKNGMVNISGDFGKGSMADRKSPKEVCRDRYLEKRRAKVR